MAITKTVTGTITIIRKWVKKIIEEGKDGLESRSPSRVFFRLGQGVGDGMAGGINSRAAAATAATAQMAGGLGGAVSAGSAAARGIASDRGLQVGYLWGRSVISGADAVIKQADFRAMAAPQIGSAQAKTALGRLGMLGPAGSGAQIWKTPMVTLGGTGGPAQPPPKFEFNLNIDGAPIRVIATQVVEQSFDALAGSITRQAG